MRPTRQPRTTADLPVLPYAEGETKQRWVYRQIAHAVDGGLLQAGDSVPSTRVLAARWGMSRGVVELAFEQLVREGYLETKAGRGTRVGAAPPRRFLHARTDAASPPPAQDRPLPGGPDDGPSTAEDAVPALPPNAHPVRAGQPFIARTPDVQGFDLREWRRCIVRAAGRLGTDHLGDADPRGLPALRQQVSAHLALSRGVRCDPDDVLIVTGIRHAVDLCAQVAISPGEVITLEDPGYPGAHALFALRGLRTEDIAVDAEGIDVQALRRTAARMVYVTPAHQAPTGVALSARRRAALLAWAEAEDAWILEDDYDSDYSYEHAPWPALKSQDRADRVVLCGSFNKSMFAGLRIGYVVAPAAWRRRLVAARGTTARSNPVLDQLALVEYMQSGALLRHLGKTRLAYKARRDHVVQALLAAGWCAADFEGLHAGFHFVLRLPPGVDEAAMVDRLGESGIVVQGVRSFWRGRTPAPMPGLLIGYAALTAAQARWSGRQLASVLALHGARGCAGPGHAAKSVFPTSPAP